MGRKPLQQLQPRRHSLKKDDEAVAGTTQPASSGCVLCERHQSSQQQCLRPLLQTETHVQPPAENGNPEDPEHERLLLLAAIDNLRQAAEAALERAEAAERSEAAAMQRLKAAENVQVMQQKIEARIKGCVIEEVQAVIRAASSEATAELRAAAEEIKQLRLNGTYVSTSYHDARLNSTSVAASQHGPDPAAASPASHGPVLLGRAAVGGYECRSSTDAKIGGCVPKGEIGSRVMATLRCRSGNGKAAVVPQASASVHSSPGSGSSQLRKPSSQDGASAELGAMQTLQTELSPCCEAMKESPEPETLRVRDVVSKLERHRDASVGCLEERFAPIRVRTMRGAHVRGISAAQEQRSAFEARCFSLCSTRNVATSADGSGGALSYGAPQTQPWRGRASGRASTPQLGSDSKSRFVRMT